MYIHTYIHTYIKPAMGPLAARHRGAFYGEIDALLLWVFLLLLFT